MDTALGKRPRRDYMLTTNYRNTVEIADVAARVLAMAVPGARPARAVRSSGYEPAVTVPGDLAEAVRDAVTTLLEEVEGTIGVIVPMAGEQGDRRDLATGFPERVQVLDVLEAKGLEFDAAVIALPEEVAAQSAMGLRTLYVALSRATQRLTVLTTDPEWRDALMPTG
jgi:DNA helicase IV